MAASRARAFIVRCLCDWDAVLWIAAPMLLAEALLCLIIIRRVPYTPIDWRAYMEEVAGPIEHGQWDYSELRGETGPLVYPAGFVYIYGALRRLGGGDGADIRTVQYAFAAVYLVTLALVIGIYATARPRGVQPWVLAALCLSKRLHSLFVLRLFNDCWAMLLFYGAVLLFSRARWSLGCVVYSLAVSVKMNVILTAPGLLILLIEATGPAGAAARIAICAAVQLALGAPFLATAPLAYMRGAFGGFGDLKIKWTVNWKFLPAEVFFSRGFTLCLLAAHLAALGWLATRRWRTQPLSLPALAAKLLRQTPAPRGRLEPEHVVAVMLGSNFVGVAFARSLHFQFYSWRAPRPPPPASFSRRSHAARCAGRRRGADHAPPRAVAGTTTRPRSCSGGASGCRSRSSWLRSPRSSTRGAMGLTTSRAPPLASRPPCSRLRTSPCYSRSRSHQPHPPHRRSRTSASACEAGARRGSGLRPLRSRRDTTDEETCSWTLVQFDFVTRSRTRLSSQDTGE